MPENLTPEQVKKIWERNKEAIDTYLSEAPFDRLGNITLELIDESRQVMRLCVEYAKAQRRLQGNGFIDIHEDDPEWQSLYNQIKEE